jgi:hypothetical protein
MQRRREFVVFVRGQELIFSVFQNEPHVFYSYYCLPFLSYSSPRPSSAITPPPTVPYFSLS